MKQANESLLELNENLNGRVVALTDLVEAIVLTHQDMYAKVEHLEKRIKLVESVNDFQDREMELIADGGMGK